MSLTFSFHIWWLLNLVKKKGVVITRRLKMHLKKVTLGHITILLVHVSNTGSVFSISWRNINFGSVIFVIIFYTYEKMRRRRDKFYHLY